MVTTSPLAIAGPSSARAESAGRGFAAFDERVTNARPGLVFAHAAQDAADAVLGHAIRRVRASFALTLTARPLVGAPIFRQLGARLSLGDLPSDPAQCAERIALAATARRAAFILPLPAPGTWDRAVLADVARRFEGLFVVVASATDGAGDLARGERFEISGALEDEERRTWWAAVAEEGGARAPDMDLARLHDWWTDRARALHARPAEIALPQGGEALFTALSLLGRPFPESEVSELGPGFSSALRRLAYAGVVRVDRGWVEIESGWDRTSELARANACAEERLRVAFTLTSGNAEPWGLARAAVLFAEGSLVDEADASYERAVSLLDDPLARREIVSMWMDAVDALEPAAQLALRTRAAERALATGHADEACAWAKAAVPQTVEGTDERAALMLVLGRAAVALGDLATAKVALRSANADGEGALAIAVEIAEVHYLGGDLNAARYEASRAEAESKKPDTRLDARNVLGKILLAETKWEEADQHFAEDAQAAIALGNRSAELRARINRGIALMSRGLRGEAQSLLAAAAAESEKTGDLRMAGAAMENLAVLAAWRHDYMGALDDFERAVHFRKKAHGRANMPRLLGNMADVQLSLGLVERAAQSVAFGRRALMPETRIKGNMLGVIGARIALTRKNTVQARQEISRALADCEAIGDQLVLGIAHAVATRVALEDGDVARARDTLDRARQLASTAEERTEVALLTAMHARAAGLPETETLALANDALLLSRRTGKEDLEREAHALLCELYRIGGNLEAARAHIDQALLLRDRTADRLRADVREAFLSLDSIQALSRLRDAIGDATPSPDGPCDDARSSGTMPVASQALSVREIVGDDPAIRGLLQAVRKVARSNATVLIHGESGTGKELVAEALHRASDRATGPLVTVNCAALVETLLLSELFGHEKGAFTGAQSRRRGRFELAEGGTLFLDEIGDISARTQVALLRVLQERTFERVGGTTPIRANVRIVCATHRDLRAMVERGEFREDLYYRLRGITLEVPALRARLGDLPRIAEALLDRIAKERGEAKKMLSAEALDLLGRHRWPGNVRELENALRAASLFAEGTVISAADVAENVDDLRPLVGKRPSVPPPVSFADVEPLVDDEIAEDAPLPSGEANATTAAYAQVRQGAVSLSDLKRQIERDCIARALAETKGNITRAAALLGMKRPRLSQLVKQYSLSSISSEVP